jgi:Uma2 family endonuclease
MSAEEFLRFRGEPGKRYELVDGELVEMSPPGGVHGEISLEIGALVRNFVRPLGLGVVYAAETGFLLRRNPDQVRAPDVAFVTRSRLPEGRSPEGWIPPAPDFAVEVVSPNDTAAEAQERVDDWLNAGTQVVWLVYPSKRNVMIFCGLDRVERRSGDDELDAEPVLPGFRCKLSERFPSA